MIPGLQSRLSESTVASTTTVSFKSDIVYVTGTTAIATIRPPSQGGFSTIVIVIATNAAGFATTTAGNIQTAVSVTTNLPTMFIYSFANTKWYVGAIS
jgi:hypothetical protein